MWKEDLTQRQGPVETAISLPLQVGRLKPERVGCLQHHNAVNGSVTCTPICEQKMSNRVRSLQSSASTQNPDLDGQGFDSVTDSLCGHGKVTVLL